MPKTKISEFSATPGNNTDIDGINIAEGCPPSGINDAIRELMAQLKDFQAGTAGDSFNGPVGTTTAAAGAFTTLSASSTVSGAGFSTYLASPPAIGGTVAAAGSFTTLSASSSVTLSGGTANGVAYLNGSKALTTGSALTFDGTNLATTGDIVVAQNKFVSWGNQAQGITADNTSAALRFFTGYSEQARLNSTGLGIGTSSPGRTLHVAATTGTSYVARFEATASSLAVINFKGNATGDFTVGIGADGENLVLSTGTTTRATLDSSGNLGIGTSSPGAKLGVLGADNTASSQTVKVYSNNGLASMGFSYSQISVTGDFGIAVNGSTSRSLTLDSSGNLGLGVTPSAWSGSYTAMQIRSLSLFGSTSNSEASIGGNVFVNTSGQYAYRSSTVASLYQQVNGSHSWFTAPSGTAGNTISFTQALTLDANGNLLLGTTSDSIGGTRFIVNQPSTTAWANFIQIGNGGNADIYTNISGTASYTALSFRNNGTTFSDCGSITVSGTATAFNTSSDYRLKNITGPITNSGAYIDSLKPVEGTWKADGSTFVGLIAHEAQEVSRTTVATGTKDGEQMQGMDYSNSEFIANIIAELQSLRARVAALETK